MNRHPQCLIEEEFEPHFEAFVRLENLEDLPGRSFSACWPLMLD